MKQQCYREVSPLSVVQLVVERNPSLVAAFRPGHANHLSADQQAMEKAVRLLDALSLLFLDDRPHREPVPWYLSI